MAQEQTKEVTGEGKAPRMYQIQCLYRDGWRNHTTTSTTGNNAFFRLIGRVRAGEIDPREENWRLVPVTMAGQILDW